MPSASRDPGDLLELIDDPPKPNLKPREKRTLNKT